MLVNAEKIGIYSKKSIDVFNLRGEPEFVLKSVGKVGYFPGYHMNRKTWYTSYPDNINDQKDLISRVDISYELGKKHKTAR